ncbi:MAG: carboxylating nicotinate-nucleotide diphosphorylase [Elusimicrobia bacterium]|nr:carboxylating nicotinate-nucleotide diphosphorylase [Elusimicrobiota bacterium]
MDINTIVKLALKEDIAKGDITTNTFIPKSIRRTARFVAKESGIICGLDIAKIAFKQLDKNIIYIKKTGDSQWVKKGQVLAVIKGNARAILTAERTALNFLQHLSGIATLTGKYVKEVKSERSKVRICDTRKTTPLLRNPEKYAVRCGGGCNHRLNLSDMVMIKDNHIKSVKNLKLQVTSLKKHKPKIKIEIEARSFSQVKKFVVLKPDIIMLDNMELKEMLNSIKYIRKNSNCKIEISGNVSLNNLRKLVNIKPDIISIGKITHSAPALDISLELL